MCIRLATTVAALGLLSCTAAIQAAPIGFETAVLASNPYAYYRLNESPITAGTTAAADSSSTANHGGIYRIATTGTAPLGGQAGAGLVGSDNAVSFTGSSTTAGGYATLDNAGSFGSSLINSSYEFVFKTTTTGQNYLFGQANASDSTAVFLRLNTSAAGTASAGSLEFLVRATSSSNTSTFGFSAPALFDGNYHHLLVTYSATTSPSAATATAYVDGNPVAVTKSGSGVATTFSAFEAARPANIGAITNSSGLNGLLTGTVDEVAIYTSVLSQADATTHAAASAVPEPAALASVGLFAALSTLRRRRMRR
jgi:hypothetical protein